MCVLNHDEFLIMGQGKKMFKSHWALGNLDLGSNPASITLQLLMSELVPTSLSLSFHSGVENVNY